jgi:hypothetical protein
MPNRARKTIAVLWHERQQRLRHDNYMIMHYAAVWAEDGHDVIFTYGTREFKPADVLIVHVDLSVVPDEYLEFAARFPVVLNGRVRDIRKSTVSSLRVQRSDSWQGPVIVKSDLNFGGYPERRLGCANAMQSTAVKLPADYRVYDSTGEVPEEIWADPSVVVERFLPQMEDGEYVIHNMVFLGDRATCSKKFSPQRVIHAANETRQSWVDPHPEVVALRKQLGFDMGKFDYVIRDGKPIVFDTNKTVGAQSGPPSRTQRQVRRQRAEGLYSYFQ